MVQSNSAKIGHKRLHGKSSHCLKKENPGWRSSMEVTISNPNELQAISAQSESWPFSGTRPASAGNSRFIYGK
jgi:hypothetical protein